MCPRCHQNAPVIYRGVMAYCTACGALRPPLTGTSLNLVGQPSKIGGAVASIVGWIVLAVGVSLALLIGLIAQALFPAGIVGLALGIPIALVSLVVGVLLVRSGKSLGRSGVSAEQNARVQAIFGLATNRGGMLTALDVSRTLDMPVDEADQLLTKLAKEQYDRVAVELDSSGGLYYRFNVNGAYGTTAVSSGGASSDGAAPRVRVDSGIAQSPNRAEWERLESEEAAANASSTPRSKSVRK